MRSPPRFLQLQQRPRREDAEPRRKTAIGLGQLADLYAVAPGDVMPDTLALIAENWRWKPITKFRAS